MKTQKIIQFLLLVIYFSLPLVGMLLFIQDGAIRSHESSMIGIFFGIASFTWLSLELVLSARYRLLSKYFSFDRIYLFHGIMAVISIILAFLHHQSVEGTEESEVEFDLGFLRIEAGEDGMGETVFQLFLVLILLTIAFFVIFTLMNYYRQTIDKYSERKGIAFIKDNIITYQFFKITHNLLAIGIIALLLHVLLVNFSTQKSSSVMKYYLVIWIIGFISWLYPKFIRPILRLRHPYIVKEVIKENQDNITIKITPSNSKKIIGYKPGQFINVGFKGRGFLCEMHPYTISSSPLSIDDLSFTVKNLGGYTRKLMELKEGTIAYIEGPFGEFSYLNHENDNKPLIFIAGGIGITPLMSMLRHLYLSGDQRLVHLIWANKYKEDIFFPEEFEKMVKEKQNIKVDYILSRETNYEGLKGRLDVEKLKQLLPAEFFQNGQFFICGSNSFTNTIRKTLKKLQVKSDSIHFEKFSFLAIFENYIFPILNKLKRSKK